MPSGTLMLNGYWALLNTALNSSMALFVFTYKRYTVKSLLYASTVSTDKVYWPSAQEQYSQEPSFSVAAKS